MDSSDLTSSNPASAHASPEPPETVPAGSADTSEAMAANPGLNEDLALALLKRSDLPPEALERLSKNTAAVKGRKVKLAIIQHPKTPRYISITMLRQLFTFDLMQVTLMPAVAGDIKVAAEGSLIKRLESTSSGERLALARRASGRVAGALLLVPDLRVIQAALDNPRLTEAIIVRGLLREDSPATFVQAMCRHAKWSLRREIRIALLRNGKTPLGYALEFARCFPPAVVKEILQSSHLPENIKSCVLKEI